MPTVANSLVQGGTCSVRYTLCSLNLTNLTRKARTMCLLAVPGRTMSKHVSYESASLLDAWGAFPLTLVSLHCMLAD